MTNRSYENADQFSVDDHKKKFHDPAVDLGKCSGCPSGCGVVSGSSPKKATKPRKIKQTDISWAHHTINFWIGCAIAGIECLHCYAEAQARRFYHGAIWGLNGLRHRTGNAIWAKPVAIQKNSEATGEEPTVFCMSLGDIFEEHPELPQWRQEALKIVESCDRMDWQVLTKRPQNVNSMVPAHWQAAWPRHVWVGTSVGHSASLARIDALLQVPTRTRFLSVEPLLEELDLAGYLSTKNSDGTPAISMVIVGGESGGNARPMHPAWVRKIKAACDANGVLFHFKQWGEFLHESQFAAAGVELAGTGKKQRHQWPDGTVSVRVGVNKAGHLLDGVEYQQVINPRGVKRPVKMTGSASAAPSQSPTPAAAAS